MAIRSASTGAVFATFLAIAFWAVILLLII